MHVKLLYKLLWKSTEHFPSFLGSNLQDLNPLKLSLRYSRIPSQHRSSHYSLLLLPLLLIKVQAQALESPKYNISSAFRHLKPSYYIIKKNCNQHTNILSRPLPSFLTSALELREVEERGAGKR
jgi:hypothetical protein